MAHYTTSNPAHIGTKVFLDGKPLKDVIECDTELGWAIVYDRDESGDFILDGPQKDFLMKRRITGNITATGPS